MPLSPGVLSILGGVSQGLQAQQGQAIDRLRAIYGYMGKVDPAAIRAQQLGLDTAANNATRQIDTNANDNTRQTDTATNADTRMFTMPDGTQVPSNVFHSIVQLVTNPNFGGNSAASGVLNGVDPSANPGGQPVSPSSYALSTIGRNNAAANNYNANANVVDPARAGLYGAQTHQILSLLPQRQNLMIDQGNYLNAGTGLRDTQNSLAPGLANSLNMLRGDQGQSDMMSGQGNLDRGQAAQTNAATGQSRLNVLAPLYASEAGVNQARMKSIMTKDPDFAASVTQFDNVNSALTQSQSNYKKALAFEAANPGNGTAGSQQALQEIQTLQTMRDNLSAQLKARASQNGNAGQQQTLGTPPPGSNTTMPSVNQIQPLQPPVRNMAAGNAGQPPQGFVPLPGAKVGGVYVDPATKTYWYKGQSYNLNK